MQRRALGRKASSNGEAHQKRVRGPPLFHREKLTSIAASNGGFAGSGNVKEV